MNMEMHLKATESANGQTADDGDEIGQVGSQRNFQIYRNVMVLVQTL